MELLVLRDCNLPFAVCWGNVGVEIPLWAVLSGFKIGDMLVLRVCDPPFEVCWGNVGIEGLRPLFRLF